MIRKLLEPLHRNAAIRRGAVAFGAMLIVLTFTELARADLILNGGFETGDYTSWTQGGNTGFTGVAGVPHTGDFGSSMGPIGSDGLLSQTFATTLGTTYALDFWLESTGGPTNDFSANIDSDPPIFAIANTGSFSYTHFTTAFVGTGAPTTLTFAFRHDPAFWHLDDISVTESDASAVPEPATLTLAVFSIAAFAGHSWHKRKKVLA